MVKIKKAKIIRETTCKYCGNPKAYNFQFYVKCDKCNKEYNLLDDVSLKRIRD